MIFAFIKINIRMHLFFQVNKFKILHIQTLLYNSANDIFTWDAWTVNVATWTKVSKNLIIVTSCVLISSESLTQLTNCLNTKLHSNFKTKEMSTLQLNSKQTSVENKAFNSEQSWSSHCFFKSLLLSLNGTGCTFSSYTSRGRQMNWLISSKVWGVLVLISSASEKEKSHDFAGIYSKYFRK